ncbi:DUF4279 domain-containing protein [Caballeronia pedi]|uniref:DUF4279 domain-containing protein n=1 Tax=Caballeronia pedi TaxID=1777141 RepID=UPI001FC96FC7|nr:DUF4279 domain-containing protein [Caballeronia pedi]
MSAEVRLAYASFTIGGEGVVPQFWTDYFGVKPSVAKSKGDPIRGPGGLGTMGRRTGVWSVSSASVISSDQLAPHLRYLTSYLALPRADLRVLLEQAGVSARMFCFWVNESGDRIPDIPADIRSTMEAIGGTIEIDEYR